MGFDLQMFNSQVSLAMTEIVDQEVNKFNEASRGAITLRPSGVCAGDYAIEASFKRIQGLVRRRNMYGTGDLTTVPLQQIKDVAVKVAAGTPPVEFKPSEYEWILQDPALAAVMIGEQLAPAKLQDMLNVGLSAAVAAVSGNAAVVSAVSGSPKQADLAKAAGKFGDRSQSMVAWVLHSTTMINLWIDGLGNASNLFTYGTVNVVADPFGRVFVISDAAALGNGTNFNTLGLVANGLTIDQNDDFTAVMVDGVGKENITRTYQAEWSYNVGVLGYAWDTVSGGPSPTDAAIATSSNWEKIATGDKDTAGVLLQSN